jgi:hypothetical protein
MRARQSAHRVALMKFGSPPALFVRGVVRRYDADGGGKLLILSFKILLFRRHRRDRPHKSGGPPLFELSLKVQRNVAHNPAPGFEALPRCCGIIAQRALITAAISRCKGPKCGPTEIGAAWLCDGRGSRTPEPADQTRTSGPAESYRGYQSREQPAITIEPPIRTAGKGAGTVGQTVALGIKAAKKAYFSIWVD